ncbi:hypothetical protein TWF718_007712 [Orbilia javanica]|uniref:Clr5 domain-containing protein n=1 Tax=Orbilia javanica TaxID=47235 RepID=A0AAN8MVQ9_9PEZI
MELDLSQLPARKRSARCDRLDEPQIRSAIEILYSVELLSVKQVQLEVNKTYNLNATQSQYRDRLHKWGCRKRLNNREYHKVYRDLLAREELGKKSEITLSQVVKVPMKRFERWTSRNITFTDRMMTKVSSTDVQTVGDDTRSSLPLVLVRTPPSFDIDIIPTLATQRFIPISTIKSLPIWQASRYLEQFADRYLPSRDNNGSAVRGQHLPSYYPLLRAIIYQLSNNIIDEYKEHLIEPLLKQVDSLNARAAFRKLLSNNTVSIVTTCQSLVVPLYQRGDIEMLEWIRASHPEVTLNLYDILPGSLWGGKPDNSRRLLEDIEKDGSPPRNGLEAMNLLYLCLIKMDNLDIFLKLWNPRDIKVAHIEDYKYRRHSLEVIPLFTDCPKKLGLLLSLGFGYGIWASLLQKILRKNFDIASILLRHVGIEVDPRDRCSDLGGFKPSYEIIGEANFLKILKNAASEKCFVEDFRKQGFRLAEEQIVDWVLIRVAWSKPEMRDFAMRLLQRERKRSISKSELFTAAIDLLFFEPLGADLSDLIHPEEISFQDLATDPAGPRMYFGARFWGSFERRKLPMLKMFVEFGADINQTQLWRQTLWEVLEQGMCWGRYVSTTLEAEFLAFLLDAGADPEMAYEQVTADISSRLYSRVLRNAIGRSRYETDQTPDLAKPIEFLYFYDNPLTFCTLATRLTDVEDFIMKITTLSGFGLVFSTQFFQALRDRNIDLVKALWAERFTVCIPRAPEQQLISALTTGNMDLTKAIFLQNIASYRLLTLVSVLVEDLAADYSPIITADHNEYNHRLEMLRWVLNQGANFSTIPEFNSRRKPYIQMYNTLLSRAMYRGSVELFSLLLSFVHGLDSQDSAAYLELQKRGLNPVPRAAELENLDFLKLLIDKGFDINEPFRYIFNGPETALYFAVKGGRLQNVTYVLKQGGDIYAPCLRLNSVIEFAVRRGRLDSVALFLAVDPECYDIALEAAILHKEKLMERFIRDWKLKSQPEAVGLSGDASNQEFFYEVGHYGG